MLSSLITQNQINIIEKRVGGTCTDEQVYGTDCADGFTHLQTHRVVNDNGVQLSVCQKQNLFAVIEGRERGTEGRSRTAGDST